MREKQIVYWTSIFITVLIFTPIILSQFIRIPFGVHTIGNEGSWVSSFGSYRGSVLGVIGVVFTTYIIVKNNKENTEYSMKLEDRIFRV